MSRPTHAPANVGAQPTDREFFRLKAEATRVGLLADGARRRRGLAIARAVTAGIAMTLVAALLLPVGALTLFRARRLYASIARQLSRGILRLYGVSVIVRGQPFPAGQVVYVSNHTSTLDLFVLVALGLPNTRFFLSGFLRKIVPLGIIAWVMGTFFTVPQDRPAERTRIFQRAARTLGRTGESVYLSPEGARITTGEIGPFNKGAFHLATDLGVPIVPMYFHIPPAIDPGLGYDARPGVVEVHVLPAIETGGWRVENVEGHRDAVRALFVRAHEGFRCA
jgi:1-acyl-sn-glycerol-3-phosphate acyltransferase